MVTPVEPESQLHLRASKLGTPGSNQGDNNSTQPNVPTPGNNGEILTFHREEYNNFYLRMEISLGTADDNGLLIVVKSKTDDERLLRDS